jgi:hypothetical protein
LVTRMRSGSRRCVSSPMPTTATSCCSNARSATGCVAIRGAGRSSKSRGSALRPLQSWSLRSVTSAGSGRPPPCVRGQGLTPEHRESDTTVWREAIHRVAHELEADMDTLSDAGRREMAADPIRPGEDTGVKGQKTVSRTASVVRRRCQARLAHMT